VRRTAVSVIVVVGVMSAREKEKERERERRRRRRRRRVKNTTHKVCGTSQVDRNLNHVMYLQQISLHRQLEDSANEQQTKGFIVLTHKKRASSSSSSSSSPTQKCNLYDTFI
jgi:hypothetical protein